MVEKWARDLTEEVLGGAPVAVGRSYVHPEDGPVTVVSGQYWGTHGLSNFWYWRVLATGEVHCGYGGEWPLNEAGEVSE